MLDRSDAQKNKKRWPTKAVMSQIYEKSLWGGAEYDFYSGDGSHDVQIVNPYIAFVKDFLIGFESPIEVCDLGCGDFNVGHQLVNCTKAYFAIDIVADLIERNKARYKNKNLIFQCLDICKDHLPKADCAMVRQVMQHLSNSEIIELLLKLKNFKYIIVTEHLPILQFKANLDLVTGQGNRLKIKSGVVLTEAPFYFKPLEEKHLLTLKIDAKSVIKTILYKIY